MRDPLTALSRVILKFLSHGAQLARWAKTLFLLALGFILSFVCGFICPARTYAQDSNCNVIPVRQEFWIRLKDPVSTYSSKKGATVQAILTASPLCDGTPLFATGTVVEGHITYVRKVGFGVWHDSSAVAIAFDTILAGSTPLAVRTRVEEVANGREKVKRGVIEGVGGRNTPQQIMSTRLLHLPFWNTEDYWIFLLRRGAFPFSPEPETYLPAGADLRVRLMAPLELPAEFVTAGQGASTHEDAEIDSNLRDKLLSLPSRTLTGSGRASDVVNLAFIGSPEQIEAAFKAAGWTYGDMVSAWSVLREMRAMSALNSYPHLPISKQWLAGKAPDLRLQKSFDSYQKREHVRLWNEDSLEKDLWAGSVIRETSASWSIRTGRFIHHVDADLAAEREKVVRDLTLAGCVANVQHVRRAERPEEEKNASGDALWTDGEVAVIELNHCEAIGATPISSSATVQWRPGSKLRRFVRAQALSIHDLWRSNVIYMSFDLSRTVIHSLRQRRITDYETHADIGATAVPQGTN